MSTSSSTSLSSIKPLHDALRNAVPPLIYLVNKEAFLTEQALGVLKSKLVSPATEAFNYEVLRGSEANLAQIQASARLLPMMGSHRLLIVQEAEEFDAAELAKFIPYLENPNPSTCLCFVSTKADLRTKFMLKWKQVGLLLSLEPLTERQLPAFIKAEAQRLEVILGNGVVEFLIEQLGSDLAQLNSAVERLSCFVDQHKTATLQDAEQCFAGTRVPSIFEFIDALGSKDRSKSLQLLNKLLSNKEPALRILAMMLRQVRQLWVARDVLTSTKGASSNEVAKAVGVPPFVAIKLCDQARRLSKPWIEAIHELIYQTDRNLKRSKVDETHYMESLVLQMVGDRTYP